MRRKVICGPRVRTKRRVCSRRSGARSRPRRRGWRRSGSSRARSHLRCLPKVARSWSVRASSIAERDGTRTRTRSKLRSLVGANRSPWPRSKTSRTPQLSRARARRVVPRASLRARAQAPPATQLPARCPRGPARRAPARRAPARRAPSRRAPSRRAPSRRAPPPATHESKAAARAPSRVDVHPRRP